MKVRALIGFLPDDSYPMIFGAADAGAWEVIEDEEWQRIVAGWKKCWAADWQSYDYREVFLTFDADKSLFEAPTLKAALERSEVEA
jgi:hypothetical protein